MKSRPKIVVPAKVSRDVGAMRLGRELTGRVNTILHDHLGNLPAEAAIKRASFDERFFVTKFVATADGILHRFTLAVDDSTAPDHWIVVAIVHFVEGLN